MFRTTAFGLMALGLFGGSSHALAAQLQASDDCNLVVHVPGGFGGTNLHLKILRGTVFTEDDHHKFCGSASQPTPLGESRGTECFTVADGKFLSGKWSNKVTSSSCVLTDAAAMRTQFAADGIIAWGERGPSTLYGQAFLKTVAGDIKTCAGSQVQLLPGTPYVEELLSKRKAGITITMDPRLQSYIRTTICDAQGNFSFAELPDLRWYVLTSVTWNVPHIGISEQIELHQQGGELVQVVALVPGNNQVFLTDQSQ